MVCSRHPAFGRQRQKDRGLQISLSYKASLRPCQEAKKSKKGRKNERHLLPSIYSSPYPEHQGAPEPHGWPGLEDRHRQKLKSLDREQMRDGNLRAPVIRGDVAVGAESLWACGRKLWACEEWGNHMEALTAVRDLHPHSDAVSRGCGDGSPGLGYSSLMQARRSSNGTRLLLVQGESTYCSPLWK